MSDGKIVGVSAGAGVPSRTTALVRAVADGLDRRLGFQTELIELSLVAPALLGAQGRGGLAPEGESVLRAVETAAVLVVGSPVYRASYTGLFKHLFDLVDQRALANRPVVLTATGGSLEHALVIEHQFRPLFGFFGALTVPTGVYAQPSDFEEGLPTSPGVLDRIARAVDEAASLVRPR
jgi:FMN reductase